jgi:hypothetical protein
MLNRCYTAELPLSTGIPEDAMGLRLVQQGQGDPRPLVVLYLVGSPMDPELCAALGPGPAIVAYDDAVGAPLITTISFVTAKTGSGVSDVILVGYSAGCQSVRGELMAGSNVSGVLAIDGTHANLPPEKWQIDVWRNWAALARQSERLFVATCTENTYVETSLPVPQRYSATISVLRLVTDFQIIPSEHPAGEHDGALHVYGYSSATTDKAAHARQQTVVLPDMLARHAKPWLERKDRGYTNELPVQQSHSSVLSPEEHAQVENAIALSLDKLARQLAESADEGAIPTGSLPIEHV